MQAYQQPAALKSQRAKIEAIVSADTSSQVEDTTEIDESSFAVTADSKPTPTPSKAPTATPPPEADLSELIGAPATEDPKWEQRYRSLDGMLKQRDRENQELRDQISTLTQRAAAPTSTPTASGRLALALQDVTVDEAKMRGHAESLPVIQKVVIDTLRSALAPVIDRVMALESSIGTVGTEFRESHRQAQKRSFTNEIRSNIPNHTELFQTSEFKQFAAQRIPYSTETVKDRLTTAWKAEDADTIIALVNEFKSKTKPAPSETTFSTPRFNGASSETDPALKPTPPKPMLAWSKRQEAGRKFVKQQINKAEMDRIAALYETAAQEGRIDYNA